MEKEGTRDKFLFLKIYFSYVCGCAHTNAVAPQRPEALNPLNLGLQVAVSCPVWVLRTKLVILLAIEPSLQPPGEILMPQFRKQN